MSFPYADESGEHFDDLWQSQDMHAFYDRMRKGSSPTTSCVSPTHMRAAFERAAESGVPTVYLCFSSGLSSHFQSACAALEDVLALRPSADIRIVDTRLGSTSEALLVYEALRQREEGLTADELEQWANEARFCVETCFMVDDLDALRRGGRIPRGVAFAGNKLNVKPILTFSVDGHLAFAGAARGRKKGLRALKERFVERVDSSRPVVVCLGHADCEEDMERLWDMLGEDGAVSRVSQPIGPVVGSHVGPGMVSLVFWGRDRRKSRPCSFDEQEEESMNINDLSPELKEKARACRNAQELAELAKEEGMEIPDEQLDAIAGGAWCSDHEWGCPGDGCGNYRGL